MSERGALIDDCVHCGFCLPACPTYRLWSHEADSPRGRIVLMADVERGGPVTPAVARHVDLCLGCMGCVTACPSGVRYDRLIEGMREEVEERGRRSWTDRIFRAALFALLPHPGRLRWLRLGLAAYQRLRLGRLLRAGRLTALLPPRLRALEALQPRLRPAPALPGVTAARGDERCRAVLLEGCVQSVFFSHVNAATARVLAAEGVRVTAPGPSCCGALSLHSGRRAEALAHARTLADRIAQEDLDALVVNAAGCGSSLKSYAELLGDAGEGDPVVRISRRTRDVSELLADLEPRAPRHPVPLRVAYHEACHLSHAQGVRAAPRRLLEAIPGLEVREPRELDQCCGSAGIYNIVEPEAASALGRRKAEAILETGSQLVVTSNPGCALQIASHLARLGRPLPVRHVVELLDASIRNSGSAELLAI
jgi:glycolate oxidase iron-sulfur subunit